MVEHNVGALVVLKPGDDKLVAGIVTERGIRHEIGFVPVVLLFTFITDYLRKIIMQGKSATSTRVGDIMTDEVCRPFN